MYLLENNALYLKGNNQLYIYNIYLLKDNNHFDTFYMMMHLLKNMNQLDILYMMKIQIKNNILMDIYYKSMSQLLNIFPLSIFYIYCIKKPQNDAVKYSLKVKQCAVLTEREACWNLAKGSPAW